MDKRKREQQINPKHVNKAKRYKHAEIQTPSNTVILPADPEENSPKEPSKPPALGKKRMETEEKKRTSKEHPPPQRPKPLSRLPVSYKNFAKPISTNDRANSTQATTSIGKVNPKTKSNSERKMVDIHQARPGPKCSKPQEDDDDDDNRVPVMLANSGGIPPQNNSLPPITETANENTLGSTKMDIEEEVCQGEGGPNYQIVETPNLIERNVLRGITRPSSVGNARNAQNQQRIRLNLECTTISGGSRCNGGVGLGVGRSSSGGEERSGGGGPSAATKNKSRKQRTYIKANAHTVHIHNHFYKE